MRKMLLLSAVLSLPACADKPSIVTTPPAACSRLIPETWAEGVPAAPVPDTDGLSLLEQVKAWATAYVAQGGQLAKANGRTADTVGIVSRCEAMVNGARPQ